MVALSNSIAISATQPSSSKEDMRLHLLKELKKEERKRKKLEADIDTLFEGARDVVSQKEEIIEDLEERLRSSELALQEKVKEIQMQNEMIEILRSKLESEVPINKYLPLASLTEEKSLRASNAETRR